MKINFVKMHGCGNDFIITEGKQFNNLYLSKISAFLCQRHFGIGADGLILSYPAEHNENDRKMRIFNPDGSEAEMCGNGIRCFAHYHKTNHNLHKQKLNIETKAGVIKPQIIDFSKNNCIVKVNMGSPEFNPEKIPVNISDKKSTIEDYPLIIKEKEFLINSVSMGNPHTVVIVEDLEDIEVQYWGKLIEDASFFPQNTNVEFIKPTNNNNIKMKVWERGVGETLACGTGACASAVVGIKKDILTSPVQVDLPGGALKIEWDGEGSDVMMSGPAEVVYTGEFNVNENEWED